MHVSEIRVKRIGVNQGLGVSIFSQIVYVILYLLLLLVLPKLSESEQEMGWFFRRKYLFLDN